jgi:hypothetical protein
MMHPKFKKEYNLPGRELLPHREPFLFLDRLVSAECVFLDAPKKMAGGNNDKPPHERFGNATRQERRQQRQRKLRRNK